MSSIGEPSTSSFALSSSPLPSTAQYASTSTVDSQRHDVRATFAWASVPNMTTCASATISWDYSGPEQPLLVKVYPGGNMSFSANATAQSYTVPTVQLIPGEYTMSISNSPNLEYPNRHAQFFVYGTDTSCFPPARRSTSTDTTITSSTTNGALIGGVAVGIGGAVTLLAVGFYFRFAAMRLFRRWRSKPEVDPEVPGHEGQWDIHHSRNVSDVSHSQDSQRRLLDSESIARTPEMRTNALPASQVTILRLEPNRRPPSTLDAGTAPLRVTKRPRPLPRLEPNRRKPSIATTAALDMPSSSDRPSAPPPPAVVPTPKVDLEAEFKPISRPTPIVTTPLLKVPKPPRRSLIRHSGISGITSASTALSDMSLLKPGPNGPVQVDFPVELQRAHALAKLDAIMDHPPLLTATPPPPSRTPSPSQSSAVTIPAPAQVPSGDRSPTDPTPRSPLSPFLKRMSAQQPLSRSGSGRSRYATRKPVPPIDRSATPAPSDILSSIIWTRPSSPASTYVWNERGSPVPSSSTSQMYRTRDSVWSGSLTGSDVTWARPIEDWEREQMRVLAVANPDPDDGETARNENAGPFGVGNGSFGRRGPVVRHQSFGDMKAMKAMVPDVPPIPERQAAQ
ncbi:hypothetical protein L226DRAFT_572964 [Lentinus tigrinus ALCF2SS1-7]|uniref:Uncharacterized protein n=1 Tax=Lentinus tigrinus ALCF2SS1-6 TaxID=1328759 RepID=A0A5C2RX79_9APHY|nr:hypothetical protein L227DRAFT_615187 [Lentinus tigrinus ALCF2SS1-6]RPD72517.1 hypothetical protein L226DRAFT_572964 [Lentinus tigrinus ALCF2SS1-7]